jgi:hypothetical protein
MTTVGDYQNQVRIGASPRDSTFSMVSAPRLKDSRLDRCLGDAVNEYHLCPLVVPCRQGRRSPHTL